MGMANGYTPALGSQRKLCVSQRRLLSLRRISRVIAVTIVATRRVPAMHDSRARLQNVPQIRPRRAEAMS